MVGHPAQRFAGSAIPRQHIAYPYHASVAPVPQTHSQHILAPYAQQDIYHFQTALPKQVQHSSPELTPEPQPSPPSSSGSSTEGDHPIGYGAFGVVW